MELIKISFISLWFVVLLPFLALGQEEEKRKKFESISRRNLRLDRSVSELLTEAEEVMTIDTYSALNKVEEALALSLTEKNRFDEARCYLLLGRINETLEEWQLAIENYNGAFEILEVDHRSTPEFIENLNGLVRSNNQLGKYTNTLQYLEKKLGVVSQAELTAETHLQMAETHFELENYSNATASVETAEAIIDKSDLKLLKSRAQAIKAKILAKTDDIEGATELYQQSQNIDFLMDDLDEEPFESSKEELISAYNRQGRVEEEIDLRNQSIASNELKNEPLKVAKEKRALSKKFIEIGNTTAALKELEDAVALADSLGDNQELANAHRALAEAWSNAGNINKSLESYRKYGEAIDQLNQESLEKNREKESILKKQQDISSLTKELALDESKYKLEETSSQLQANRIRLQQLLIYGLLFLLIVAVVSAWFIYRNAKRSKIRGLLLALKSLRSQMNPHFIFNALNSVNQFIALNDERSANKFLSEFSKLMRLVLDNSEQDFITLAEEKEIIELYLKLEHNRFRDKFEYELSIDEELPLDSIEVPPMLIQPYIENAVWHGLRYKEEPGHLGVKLDYEDETLRVEITDDGIGRVKSRSLKTEHQKRHLSTGLKNTEQRINIINKVYRKHYRVSVTDLNGDQSGTRVLLELPQNGKS